MTDTTASIAGKGCQGTGITEEIADRIADAEAGTLICIVELSYSALHKKKGGKRKVELTIEHIEPAVDGFADDYLREVQNAMYKNRALQGHVGTTTGGTEPTVQEVLANGERFKVHPFLPVNAGENDQPYCDVCGLLGTAPIHSVQEVITDDEDDEPNDAEAEEPHDFVQGPDDSCLHCGQAYHDDSDLEADLDPADEQPDPDALPNGHDDTRERHLAPVANPFENPGA